MKIYNTLKRQMEEIVPLENNHVRMYTCGPTVYDYAHIGNFRAYVFEDLLRRYLKYCGYRVTHVMNLTDVDDKTIKGSLQAKVSLDEYTRKYKDAFFGDLKTLNIESAEHYPAATAHIPEMIVLIARLVEKGYAYRSDDGSVYFSIGKFKDYGKLAHLDMSGLRAGARVVQDEYEKENVADFALWKAAVDSDGDVAWDSPWGRGRPGWHIECSAMSMKYLGESFDIHTGGIDNIFPHHEDEIAQSEAATGKPFVKYWMHCAHLVVDGRKMSKSLGNFFTLRDVLSRGYSGREVRYVLVSAQYSQTLNFSFDALNGARASLSRIDEFKERLKETAGSVERVKNSLPAWAEKAKQEFKVALDNDLNMPEALATLFGMIHEGNKVLNSGAVVGEEACTVLHLLTEFDHVLGFLEKGGGEADAIVKRLVEERQAARKAKNWAESDRIRDELAKLGWEIKDTPQGPKLRKL
ncbi:MAG: cysteine--tRNA ligase [Kiritimatiellae bacterium]|nr:cysteine--tRNA ligase [Kiritimatiellia bacterium]MDD5520384.1 cysteine--tRNA ligase [Kiritimatiellia bacterium]